MCGILGYLSLDGQDARSPAIRSAVERASDRIGHRGPDGSGHWYDPDIALAHRRLAIIDLATGDQPMSRTDLGLTIIFNGEIYNYIEIRQELAARGWVLHTQSDTEVLLVGFAEFGKNITDKLQGMFAFAIWNSKSRELFLARDPLGKKPLCFIYKPTKFFAFASEAKALLGLPGVSRKIEASAISQYLELMYVPDQSKVWSDIVRLEAGHSMSVDRSRFTIERYFQLSLGCNVRTVSFDEACERTQERLTRATQIRLRSDVPIGVFLSGGVDSSLVAIETAKLSSSRVRTFTVGFSGSNDERPFAHQVARHIDADHTDIDIELDGVSLLQDVASAFDEPFGDTSAVPTLAIARATRQFAKVVLGGDGGDEIFGGYDTYLRAARSQQGRQNALLSAFGRSIQLAKGAARRLPTPLAATIAALLRRHSQAIDGIADIAIQNPVAGHATMMRVAHGTPPSAYLSPDFVDERDSSWDAICRYLSMLVPTAPTPLRQAMAFDHAIYLPGDILKKVDIATMAAGIEVRSPLLDDDLVSDAHRYPDDLILKSDVHASSRYWGKRIPKHLLAKEMGDDFTYRKKAGFAAPLPDWLGRSEFKELAREGFASNNSPIAPWFRPGARMKLFEEYYGGKLFLAQEIWNLMCLDAWARNYHPET